MKRNQRKSKKAFTLTEVLVSVAIIVLLISLSFVAMSQSRMNSRNSKRVSNVNQIMTALESYYAANQSYPTVITPGQPIMSGSTVLLNKVPTNPSPRTDGGCPNQDYTYQTTSTGYKITFCIGSDHGRFTKGKVICRNGNCGVADTDCGPGFTVTDRDGNVYPTVMIGTQCWLGKNLYTKTNPDGSCINVSSGGYTVGAAPNCITSVGGVPTGFSGWTASAPDGSRRDCVTVDNTRGTESDCAVSGALYTWPAAMNLPNSCWSSSSATCHPATTNYQGICPTGWHIPSDSEWSTLETYLTDSPNVCNPTRDHPIGSQCLNAGAKLKIGGSSGFEAFYAGGRDGYGNFLHNGCGVDYWSTDAPLSNSTTECSGSWCATARIISDCGGSNNGVWRWNRLRLYAFSVRCIKD